MYDSGVAGRQLPPLYSVYVGVWPCFTMHDYCAEMMRISLAACRAVPGTEKGVTILQLSRRWPGQACGGVLGDDILLQRPQVVP